MAAFTDDVRHEVQRGVILMILEHRNLDWVPLNGVKQHLAQGQGYPLTESELWFHVRYLMSPGRNYTETRDTRPGRVDLSLTQVRATSRAVDLLEGRLDPIPEQRFRNPASKGPLAAGNELASERLSQDGLKTKPAPIRSRSLTRT